MQLKAIISHLTRTCVATRCRSSFMEISIVILFTMKSFIGLIGTNSLMRKKYGMWWIVWSEPWLF